MMDVCAVPFKSYYWGDLIKFNILMLVFISSLSYNSKCRGTSPTKNYDFLKILSSKFDQILLRVILRTSNYKSLQKRRIVSYHSKTKINYGTIMM